MYCNVPLTLIFPVIFVQKMIREHERTFDASAPRDVIDQFILQQNGGKSQLSEEDGNIKKAFYVQLYIGIFEYDI